MNSTLARISVLPAILLAFTLNSRAAGTSSYNPRDFGALGDGQTLDTAAINRAIDACAAAGGGTVRLTPGRYLSGTVTLKSHVALDIDGGATLLGSENPDDYPLVPDVWSEGRMIVAPLVYASGAENITLTGRGTIDGQGAVWWRRMWLAMPKKGMPGARTPEEHAEAAKLRNGRPQLVRLVRCRDVVISELNILNAAEWNLHPLLCENVRVDGVTIHAEVPSPYPDGIDPECCRNVQISNCRIDVGDDCVTLKSGLNEAGRRMGRPDEDITITNCVMYRGHGGVTIGSEMSGGVHNITVTNCVFQGTDVGIRIKAQRGRGNVVEGLTVSNIVMQDVPTPFVITTFYMGKDRPSDVYPVDEGTPRFRDFLFSNITARGAKTAGSITGLRELPVSGLSFSHLHLQAETGFSCTNSQEITFIDTEIDTDQGPSLTLHNSRSIESAGVHSRAPHAGTPLVDGLPVP